MQYTITNSDWTQITKAGESCSLWLDQQNDSAFGRLLILVLYGMNYRHGKGIKWQHNRRYSRLEN